ncbi:fimbrial biogenesis outer membrane usher protein [Serratia fonticola]|uniref:fimbria/pilus outer membrane usher protein n=1 Tax=Serratia fonticola TaxID=47917 RepID=UPI0015C66148|nr:fimbria/pilus outer membrane usher protein [Serratia fonticola]MBC3380029.1 fimbrial biogenesis outer membrane usher protein [Serratia fonticola]NYA39228.1 fimbrial biogenesis outer membrane usher protein [Serratia fonticola]
MTSLLVMAVSSTVQAANNDASERAEFDPGFFRGLSGQAVDLSRFNKGNTLTPGHYRFDVYVNGQWVGRQEIAITLTVPEAGMSYCFTPEQVRQWELDASKLPEAALAQQVLKNEKCFDAEKFIPGFKLSANTGELMLEITVPQAFIGSRRGVVAPELWDHGVTAGFVGYNLNTFRTHNRDVGNITQYFGGFNSGVNLGAWRLRHNSSYTRSDGNSNSGHYQSISTYVQRSIAPLKAQLTVGQYFTPGDQFDSVPFSGVQLTSDTRMNPDSENGFAPVIRGIANSNAKVTVRQGNHVIYEASVPPGPFAIDDLHSTGYSGDLLVTVTEADGQTRIFTVAYAAVPQMLRPGVSRFNLSAGKYRDSTLDSVPNLLLGTWQHGVSNLVTVYTGGIVAEKYQSLQGGLALNTGIGAFALDLTQSWASGLKGNATGIDEHMQGQSYRATYSKLLYETRTNFTLAAYRFSSEGYLSFSDFARARSSETPTFNEMSSLPGLIGSVVESARPRNRYQLNINQPLADGYGNLFFSGSAQNYWHSGSGTRTTFQAGYGNSYRWGSFNVGISRTIGSGGQSDTQYLASITIPLGNRARAPMLTTSLNYSDSKNTTAQTTLSGTMGENNQLSYNAFGSSNRADSHSANSLGGNVQYSSPYAVMSGGASSGSSTRQLNLGLSGSVVAHPGGINFTQYQGETMAVVQAKGAEGAVISSNVGAAVQGNGFGVVSGLMPYRQNEIALDPKGTSRNVEILGSSQQVAPSAGAITMLKYQTETGVPVMLQATRTDGKPIPLGSEVLDNKGNYLAMVGQGDLIFVRGLLPQGQLLVKWGPGETQHCSLQYRLPAGLAKMQDYPKVAAKCVL